MIDAGRRGLELLPQRLRGIGSACERSSSSSRAAVASSVARSPSMRLSDASRSSSALARARAPSSSASEAPPARALERASSSAATLCPGGLELGPQLLGVVGGRGRLERRHAGHGVLQCGAQLLVAQDSSPAPRRPSSSRVCSSARSSSSRPERSRSSSSERDPWSSGAAPRSGPARAPSPRAGRRAGRPGGLPGPPGRGSSSPPRPPGRGPGSTGPASARGRAPHWARLPVQAPPRGGQVGGGGSGGGASPSTRNTTIVPAGGFPPDSARPATAAPIHSMTAGWLCSRRTSASPRGATMVSSSRKPLNSRL